MKKIFNLKKHKVERNHENSSAVDLSICSCQQTFFPFFNYHSKFKMMNLPYF